jgi:hypothetical protein
VEFIEIMGIYRTHIMEYGSSFGTSIKLGSRVVHGPIVYIYHTISSLQMEIDLVRLSPHNLEVHGIHPCDSPLSDRC